MTWNYYNLTKSEDNDRLFETLREQLDLFQSVLEGNEDSTLKFNIKIFKANVNELLSKLEG